MITATPEAIEAIRVFLEKNNLQKPVRIHLQSTGCCDASLGLMADDAHENDLVQDIQGITFVISPEVLEMTGNITIDYVSQQHKTGFVLTSKHPVSEWSGFGVCAIKG